jgi:hypothetical protein
LLYVKGNCFEVNKHPKTSSFVIVICQSLFSGLYKTAPPSLSKLSCTLEMS